MKPGEIQVISLTSKDFLKGMSPLQQAQSGTGGFFANVSAVDLYRNPGFISPGIPSTSFGNTNLLTDFVRGVGGFDGNQQFGYAIINGKLYRYDLATYTLTNGTGFPHTFIDSASQGNDIIKFTVNSLPAIFYFTDQYFGILDTTAGQPINGNTFTDQFSNSGVSSGGTTLQAFPHKAVVYNGRLYFTNGTSIGMYDYTVGGTFGTLSANKLALSKNFIAYDIKNVKGYLEINASDGAQAKKIIWDGVSTLPNDEEDLEDATVGATQTLGGVPIVFTGGSTSGVLLRQKNFYGYEPVQNVYNGSVPTAFQSDSVASQVFWGDTNNSKIWSYGTAFPSYSYRGNDETGQFPDVLNCPISCTGTTIDSIKRSINGKILVASHTGGSYYLEYFDLKSTTYNTSASFQTNFLPLPNDSIIKYVTFYFLPLSSGDAFTPRFYFNYGTSPIIPVGDASIIDINVTNQDVRGNSQTFLMSQQNDAIAIGGTWSNCSANTNKVVITGIDIGIMKGVH